VKFPGRTGRFFLTSLTRLWVFGAGDFARASNGRGTRNCPLWTIWTILWSRQSWPAGCPKAKTGLEARRRKKLLPELQLLGQRLITGRIRAVQIIEQAAAFAHHEQHTTTAAMILLVLLKMLRQGVNLLSEKGNLDIGRAGVFCVDAVFGDGYVFFEHDSVSGSLVPPSKRFRLS